MQLRDIVREPACLRVRRTNPPFAGIRERNSVRNRSLFLIPSWPAPAVPGCSRNWQDFYVRTEDMDRSREAVCRNEESPGKCLGRARGLRTTSVSEVFPCECVDLWPGGSPQWIARNIALLFPASSHLCFLPIV